MLDGVNFRKINTIHPEAKAKIKVSDGFTHITEAAYK